MRTWMLLLGTGGILAGVVCFQQFRLHQLGTGWERREAALLSSAEQLRREVAALKADLEAAGENIARMRAAKQNRLDRIENLETQRDHLDRSLQEATRSLAEARKEREKALAEREEALHAKLQARALPDKLREDLRLGRARIAELEKQLDRLHAARADFPPLLTIADTSADGTVFLLAGDNLPTPERPLPVLLCRDGEVLLEGWLNRREGAFLVGHSGPDALSASALVKGEKVFMVRP